MTFSYCRLQATIVLLKIQLRYKSKFWIWTAIEFKILGKSWLVHWKHRLDSMQRRPYALRGIITHRNTGRELLSCPAPAPAPCSKGIPVHQTRSQHHETARVAYLAMLPHADA